MPGPTRLAWAATIVLALGIGWFGRDFAPRADMQSPKLEQADASARETAPPVLSEPVAAPVPPPSTSAPVADARANALRDQPATIGSAGQARGTAAGAVGEQPQAGQRVQSSELRAAERSTDALQLKTAQSIAAVRDSQQQQGQQAPPLQQHQLRRDSAVATQAAANQAGAGGGRGGRGGGASGVAVVAAPPPTPQPAPVAAAAMAKIASEAWEYLDLARAEQRIGRTILVVPGLQVDTVGLLNTVAGYRVRLTHRLPSGDALELIQEPVTAPLLDAVRSRQEVAVVQAAPVPQGFVSGIAAITINRPDVILTGRARITPDSLRVLLQRVR